MLVQEMEDDALVHTIQQKLDDTTSKTLSEEQPISNDDILIGRDHERDCYEPEIVRIGLLHGTGWYDTMYKDKYSCLLSVLQRRGEKKVKTYVTAMKNLVESALKCYVNPQDAKPVHYVEMMLLGSCFIIESFRRYKMLRDEVLSYNNRNEQNITHTLQRDLIRIGNQLPFFVLLEFYDMVQIEDQPPFIDLALMFFHNMVGPYNLIPNANIQHLLDLVYCTFSDPKTLYSPIVIKLTELEFIDYATELDKTGVKFRGIGAKNFLDIRFKNGVMEIPPLQVTADTLYLLRNLMEYEKQFPVFTPRCINDYAKFMQCLLNSPKDVKLLRRSGIIDNRLGNDGMIFNRLNKLGSEAEILGQFTYSELLKNVNEHCRQPRNLWMANLRRNYFNSPWSLISLIAAFVLFFLTVTQTVFSILSFHHP